MSSQLWRYNTIKNSVKILFRFKMYSYKVKIFSHLRPCCQVLELWFELPLLCVLYESVCLCVRVFCPSIFWGLNEAGSAAFLHTPLNSNKKGDIHRHMGGLSLCYISWRFKSPLFFPLPLPLSVFQPVQTKWMQKASIQNCYWFPQPWICTFCSQHFSWISFSVFIVEFSVNTWA